MPAAPFNRPRRRARSLEHGGPDSDAAQKSRKRWGFLSELPRNKIEGALQIYSQDLIDNVVAGIADALSKASR